VREVLLAVDYGRVRLGLAVSDALGLAAHPLPALRRAGNEADRRALARLVAERDVRRLVVGLPLNMDGSEGPMAAEVRAWATATAEALGLPLELEDERLSTDEAETFLQGAGLRPSDRKRLRDSVAAAVILQGVLERQRPAEG
jgi:putative Holliday junction resolvase